MMPPCVPVVRLLDGVTRVRPAKVHREREGVRKQSGCARVHRALQLRLRLRPDRPPERVPSRSTGHGVSHEHRRGPDAAGPGPSAPPNLVRQLYRTGTRNYFRVIPTERVQFAANAVLARQLGLESVFVVHDGDPLFGLSKAIFFRTAAERMGVEIDGFRRWGRDASPEGLAGEIARSRADGVFLAGGLYADGGSIIRALRARLGPRFVIMAPEFLPIASLFDDVGPAARGVYVSLAGPASERLTSEGRRFMRQFGGTQSDRVDRTAAYAGQATEVLLDAIARSDGTRESVVRELHALRVTDGILGDFAFGPTGDTTANRITILRAQRGAARK